MKWKNWRICITKHNEKSKCRSCVSVNISIKFYICLLLFFFYSFMKLSSQTHPNIQASIHILTLMLVSVCVNVLSKQITATGKHCFGCTYVTMNLLHVMAYSVMYIWYICMCVCTSMYPYGHVAHTTCCLMSALCWHFFYKYIQVRIHIRIY